LLSLYWCHCRESVEKKNCRPSDDSHLVEEEHPYLEDSIDRYFRSLEKSDGGAGRIVYDPVISFPTNKGVSMQSKNSTSHKEKLDTDAGDSVPANKTYSRVEEITESLLKSINNNDNELFSQLVSSFAADEGKRPLEFLSVRDSEDFIYDHPVGNGRSALKKIPEHLKNELCFDLGESASSVMMRQRTDAMRGPIVGDSMTFDYADIENPMDSLPETLKEQLKLDLRDSRDSYVLEPKKSNDLKPLAAAKRVNFLPPRQGVKNKCYEDKSKSATQDGSEHVARKARCSDEPEFSKSVAVHREDVAHKSQGNDERLVDESRRELDQSFHFKTADFLKYKRERRSIEFKKSAEDGDELSTMRTKTNLRPRSAVQMIGRSPDRSAASKEMAENFMERPVTASYSTARSSGIKQLYPSEATQRQTRSPLLEDCLTDVVDFRGHLNR